MTALLWTDYVQLCGPGIDPEHERLRQIMGKYLDDSTSLTEEDWSTLRDSASVALREMDEAKRRAEHVGPLF